MTTTARRGVVLVAAAVAGVLAAGAPASGAADLGAFSGPICFEAPAGVALGVDDRRYVGTLEARVGRGGGVTLVDELSLDAYLEGLAEMPVSWPAAALEAQAVAARTYAWWELESGVWQDAGYDLCGTQACQVFAGRDVVEADPEGRWSAAVAATSGTVLVEQDGTPMLARYSSSNGGASVANVERFPEDGDLPYLRSVDDPFDAVSPWHEWRVRFPRDDLDAILARGATLSAAVPLADVRVEEVDGGPDLVVVTGADGTEASVTAPEFRFFVAREAERQFPDRYPPPRIDDDGRLPATLLSAQLRFTVTDDEVVVDGHGFGHGVGMSQYGALGRAEAGQAHEEILAAYYGGGTPVATPDVPRSIRVGTIEDADEVAVVLPSPVPVVVGGTVLTRRGIGTWRVERRADRTLQLIAPTGFGAPLVVDPTRRVGRGPARAGDGGVAPSEGDGDTPADGGEGDGNATVLPGGVVRLETVVNKPVELVVEVRDATGEVVTTTPAGVVEAGRHQVDWSVADAVLDAGVDGGGDGGMEARFDVAVVAVDEDADRAGTATPVTIAARGTVASVLGPPPGPAPAREAVVPLVVAGVLGGVAGGLLAGATRRRRAAPRAETQPSEHP